MTRRCCKLIMKLFYAREIFLLKRTKGNPNGGEGEKLFFQSENFRMKCFWSEFEDMIQPKFMEQSFLIYLFSWKFSHLNISWSQSAAVIKSHENFEAFSVDEC